MQKAHAPGRFLAGIAALIRDASGAYLLLRRSDDRDYGAGGWECVTGRVNQGESFEEALHREVFEESGLRVRIDALIGLSHFYRGDAIPDNELQGVIFGCAPVSETTVRRSDEHSEHRWVRAEEATGLLTETDPGTRWLRRTIERAEQLYAKFPGGTLTLGDGVTL